MGHLPASLVWLLFAAPWAVHSLSAHSPRDLFSHPQYAVVVSEHAVLNDSIPNLIASAKSGSDNISSAHVLRTASGQAFLCTVPYVSEDEVEELVQESTKDADERQQERERGLEHGLVLLEPLRQQCLYSKQNWFTYSFCYGQDIRQFHEIHVPNQVDPVEDPNNWSYTLGRFPPPVQSLEKPKYGSGSAALAQTSIVKRVPATLGGGGELGLGDDDGGLYLTQIWDDGTLCDKTGLPREVEVQFHCNTQTIDRIALIRETAICRYVMIIHTPRLCGEPVFLERQRSSIAFKPASQIECRPVVRHMRESVDAPRAPTGPPMLKDHRDELIGNQKAPTTTAQEGFPAPIIEPPTTQQEQQPEGIVEDIQHPSLTQDQKEEEYLDSLPEDEWLQLVGGTQGRDEAVELEFVYDPVTGEIDRAEVVPPNTPIADPTGGATGGENGGPGRETFDELKDRFLSQVRKSKEEEGKEENDEEAKAKQFQAVASTLAEALRQRAAAAAAGGDVGGQRVKPIIIPVDAPGGLAGAVHAALQQAQQRAGAGAAEREGPPPGPVGYEGPTPEKLQEVKGSKDFEKLTEALRRRWEVEEEEEKEDGPTTRSRDEL